MASDAIPYGDFELPGLRTPKASFKLKIAFAYNNSYRTNPRNLEHPSYGAWTQVFEALTCELPTTFVVPQNVLWFPTPDDQTDPNASIGSESTEPDAKSSSRLPDWALVRAAPGWNPHRWELDIKRHGVPLIAEAKRAASRRTDGDVHLRIVARGLVAAQEDAVEQAAYLFRIDANQKEVIMIACSGDYWTCRVINSAHEQILNAITLPTDDYRDLCPDEEDEAPAGALNDVEMEDVITDDELKLKSTSASRIPVSEPGYLQPPLQSDSLVLPTKWSETLRMNTEVSNQFWYLIHQRLMEIEADSHTWTRG